ncbi:hypothetical protein RFI_12857 [Reticulomyxa filosa]|uniref:SAM domain-containing protein n=1 Tax=Reticulomyxa filosa TaxID=46433 RepID=X6NEI0_RETFI|nr:hypothetical protein RFI_12857 [Reticulomyxa filosa]|eukprot:ETO24298.1 hypothetical protein RFI_12857 [Reticulomyxa filosa]
MWELLQPNNAESKENDPASSKPASSAKGAKNFLSNKITALRMERDEIKQQMDALQLQFKDANSAHEANVDEMKTKITDLQQRNTQLTQELESAQTRLKQLNTDNEELKNALASRPAVAAKEAEKPNAEEEQKQAHLDDDFDVNEIVQKVKNMADQDPQFASPVSFFVFVFLLGENEVCFWLYQMQVEMYIPRFLKMGIDGNILIGDVNEKWLKEDLGIAKLHITKILRELERLRAHTNKSSNVAISNTSEQQAVQVLELTKQLKEERELTQAYETEIAQLKAELENNDPLTVRLIAHNFFFIPYNTYMYIHI